MFDRMKMRWGGLLVCVPRTNVVGPVFLRGGGNSRRHYGLNDGCDRNQLTYMNPDKTFQFNHTASLPRVSNLQTGHV